MATLRADRRLYVTDDRSQVVEEGDPRGAWLLAGVDGHIGEGDVSKFGLSMSGGRVRYEGCPELDDVETKMPEAEPAEKAAGEVETKAMRFGGDEDDEEDGEPEAGALPDDLPGRDELRAAGLTTLEAVSSHGDLTEIDGIGRATAAKIAEYLADEDDAGES